jgi:3-mercaptopyruvate sulfurtransferase SseA
VLLADVRSFAEFSERVSGYDYLDRKGRILRAVHFGDTDEGSHLYSRRRDDTLRPPAEILAMRKERGIVSTKYPSQFDREVIFHCGGGWRSSVSFYCAWLMGYENIRNYSDGWIGWSTAYVPDPQAKRGWRQDSTDNSILIEEETVSLLVDWRHVERSTRQGCLSLSVNPGTDSSL